MTESGVGCAGGFGGGEAGGVVAVFRHRNGGHGSIPEGEEEGCDRSGGGHGTIHEIGRMRWSMVGERHGQIGKFLVARGAVLGSGEGGSCGVPLIHE